MSRREGEAREILVVVFDGDDGLFVGDLCALGVCEFYLECFGGFWGVVVCDVDDSDAEGGAWTEVNI